MILTNKTVLRFNAPNSNGRTYTPEDITFSTSGVATATAFGDLIGSYSNMRIEGDRLVCDIDISDNTMGSIFEVSSMPFVTSGYGELDQGGLVVNFELTSVFPTSNPAFDPS